MRRLTSLVLVLLIACSAEHRTAATIPVPHGPLAALMTQHASASCVRSDRTYATTFWRPPYQTCSAGVGDTTETAELDADSVVVELNNTWTVTPAEQASVFSQEEGGLTSRFGIPTRCSPTKLQWRQGDSLDMVLQIAPVSQTGTEFDQGPYRMTRMARLGPLDPSLWGC